MHRRAGLLLALLLGVGTGWVLAGVTVPDPWGTLILVAVGLVGGLLLRSWWSLLVIPVEVIVGTVLWVSLACHGCNSLGPLGDVILIASGVLDDVPLVLGAAAGTAAGALLRRRYLAASKTSQAFGGGT